MSQISAIQILRALAAVIVVIGHAQDDTLIQATLHDSPMSRIPGWILAGGVDLFFVTSGFIMVHASQRLFATPGAPMAFLARRLIRIVPLYWLITALSLPIILYAEHHGKRTFPGLPELASSFGFLPFARPEDGQWRPIAAQGWTLNYEMFFYVIFAFFVRFRRETAVAGVAASLALFVGLGALVQPRLTMLAFWSDPIVLEFAFGMGLALLWWRGYRLPRWTVAPLVALAVAGLWLDLEGIATLPAGASGPPGGWRLLGCGVPMALIFGACVLTKPAFTARRGMTAALAYLGDASYALYLFHPLMIVLTRKAYLALHLAPLAGYWPLVAADLAIAVAISLAIYRYVERPVTLRLQAWYAKPGTAMPRLDDGSPKPL